MNTLIYYTVLIALVWGAASIVTSLVFGLIARVGMAPDHTDADVITPADVDRAAKSLAYVDMALLPSDLQDEIVARAFSTKR